MELTERIKEVGLKPSDIVKLQKDSPEGPISLSQATGWLKKPYSTKAIEQLLWRLCDEKVATGVSYDRPGRKGAEFSGKKPKEPEFSMPVVKVKKITPPRTVILPADKAPVVADKANDAPQPTSRSAALPELQKGGQNLGRVPMTRKVCNIKGSSYWLLYTADYWYKLPFEMANQEFTINGKEYCLKDFPE
jgi:hypothetical protein